MKEARYKVGGHFLQTRFADIPRDKWADLDRKLREIRFHPELLDQPVETQVDVLVHEILHAQQPRVDESVIERDATELAKILCDQFSIE